MFLPHTHKNKYEVGEGCVIITLITIALCIRILNHHTHFKKNHTVQPKYMSFLLVNHMSIKLGKFLRSLKGGGGN